MSRLSSSHVSLCAPVTLHLSSLPLLLRLKLYSWRTVEPTCHSYSLLPTSAHSRRRFSHRWQVIAESENNLLTDDDFFEPDLRIATLHLLALVVQRLAEYRLPGDMPVEDSWRTRLS